MKKLSGWQDTVRQVSARKHGARTLGPIFAKALSTETRRYGTFAHRLHTNMLARQHLYFWLPQFLKVAGWVWHKCTFSVSNVIDFTAATRTIHVRVY